MPPSVSVMPLGMALNYHRGIFVTEYLFDHSYLGVTADLMRCGSHGGASYNLPSAAVLNNFGIITRKVRFSLGGHHHA